MSTHTRLKALEAEAAKKKPKRKTKAKRDDSIDVKELVVKLLEAYSKTTDNTIDDKLTALVKKNLLPE